MPRLISEAEAAYLRYVQDGALAHVPEPVMRPRFHVKCSCGYVTPPGLNRTESRAAMRAHLAEVQDG